MPMNRTAQEEELIRIAHQVLNESQSLMLPHHNNIVAARRVRFDEMTTHQVNAIGINAGRFKTNIFLLTHPGQHVTLTRQQTFEDCVIIDLTGQTPDIQSMRHFLLETEDKRYWHHAPWLAINIIRKQGRNI